MGDDVSSPALAAPLADLRSLMVKGPARAQWQSRFANHVLEPGPIKKPKRVHAAFWLIFASASRVSNWSVFFSSSKVSPRSLLASFMPSWLAQAIKVP